MTSPVYTFGPFQLDPAEQVLRRDGKPLDITPKDFGVLVVLVKNAGRIVTKELLLSEVWPGSVIEEGNLARHIFNLRQLLGSEAIETVPKRGYRFILPPAPELAPAPAAPPSDTPADLPRQRPTRWLTTAIGAVLVLLIAGFLIFSSRSPEFEAGTHTLIAEFENQTGDARLSHALVTALVVSLEQSHHVAVVSREQIKASLERMKRPPDTSVDVAVGREICQREGIPLLVSPSITKTGSTYALTARLIEARTGNVLHSYIERANGDDEILAALERIAIQVRGGVGESKSAIVAANLPLERVTTANLQALQLYSEGNRKWRSGEYIEALALFNSAVALDDEFAMAHEMLGIANYSSVLSKPALGRQHYERALALADRTTPRERRKIEANFARHTGSMDKAIDAYLDYLRLWPDDRIIRLNLANALMVSGDCKSALPQFEILRGEDDSDGGLYINMGVCHSQLGDPAAALLSYERGFELQPNYLKAPNLRYEYAMINATLGQFDRAREVFTAGLDVDMLKARSLRGLGMLDLYQGKFASAAASLRKSVDINVTGADNRVGKNPLGSGRDRIFLAHALQGSGHRADAIRELKQAAADFDLHRQVAAELRVALGQSMMRLGMTEDAELELQKARQAADSATTRARDCIARLEAELALAGSQAEAAVAALESGVVKLTDLVAMELLARALMAAGQVPRAIETYEGLINSKVLVLGWEAQLTYPDSHLMLARLYQQRGDTEKALRVIDKLLRLWSQADATAVLLLEARQLKAALSGGTASQQGS
jgi:DNA-binding winged helix-turn-helix (wHTH) protein/tetratricopeptide (TPR) repeat protein